MKLVMNMVRKPFKAGDVIFDFGDRSDEIYLIHSGSVEIVSREGLVLATLKAACCSGKWPRSWESASGPPAPSQQAHRSLM